MRRSSNHLWVIVFIILQMWWLPANATSVSVDGKLELWFEYDGRQATLTATPTIKCRRKVDAVSVDCDLYRSDDGRYWIDRPPYGDYLIDVELNEHGNDFYRRYPLAMDRATTGPLLITLNRVIRLQYAEDEGGIIAASPASCREYARHKVPILTLFQMAELNFTWQSLDDADAYYYKVWRMRCADGLRIEPVRMGRIQGNAISESVPRNEDGEYYRFELIARHGNQDVGQLLLHNAAAIVNDGYPFVVMDPLGERSWYPYLLLALLTPLLLWLLWRLLPGIAVLRPGRGTAWLVIVSLLVFAGYQFRYDLLRQTGQVKEWLQQSPGFHQKWYRNQAGKEAYTEQQIFNRGTWAGYLVASGSEPFFGATRRLEIRIDFTADAARVSLLQHGHWQRVGDGDFTLKRSGTGMTLFGHSRTAQARELWTISIAEMNAPTLDLALDRMITRREVSSGEFVSERRKATGELHHSLP